jgi:hypothetical protein
MYRSRGLYAIVAVLTAAYFTLFSIFWEILRGASKAQSWPDQVVFAAIIILYFLLAFRLWPWLSSRFSSMRDLAVLIMAGFTFAYIILAAIGWAIVHIKATGVNPTRRFDLIPISAAVLYVWLFIVIKRSLDIRQETIPSGIVAGIQRHKVFHRLAEPGLIWIIGRIERILYRIKTGHRRLPLDTDILRMGDLVYKYSLDIHYRLTPGTIPHLDDEKINRLLADQRDLTRTTVHDTLRYTTAQYAARQKHSYRMDWFDTLVLVIPGTPACDSLMQEVSTTVMNILTPEGISLDRTHGIVIARFHIPGDVKQRLTPDQIRQFLRQRNPTVDDTTIAHVITWVEKAKPLPIRLFTGKAHTRKSEPPSEKPPTPDTTTQEPSSPDAASQRPPYSLSKRDLSVIKTISHDVVETVSPPVSRDHAKNSAQPPSYTLSKRDLSIMKKLPC